MQQKVFSDWFLALPLVIDIFAQVQKCETVECTHIHVPQNNTGSKASARCIMGNSFLMTDSICHSSLPRTVLEKVTLTTIQFCIHPRTKVDPVFQCVYISTPLKSCPYKSSATCAWSMARVAEKTHLNICANNKGADQPAHPRRLISAFVVSCSSFFCRRRSVSQT